MVSRPRYRLPAALILGAALSVGMDAGSPANAQFFEFFQRPPASRETPRQPWGAPQQGRGFPFGWGGQTDQGRPLFDQPRDPHFGQPRYDGRSPRDQLRYERRRRPAPRDVESRQAQEDFSKAPPARKLQVEPRKKVIVLGDSMADWLAYGLEESLSEHSDEVGVVRMHRTPSGLIRGEAKDHDWVQAAHELLAHQAADFIIVMIGF